MSGNIVFFKLKNGTSMPTLASSVAAARNSGCRVFVLDPRGVMRNQRTFMGGTVVSAIVDAVSDLQQSDEDMAVFLVKDARRLPQPFIDSLYTGISVANAEKAIEKMLDWIDYTSKGALLAAIGERYGIPLNKEANALTTVPEDTEANNAAEPEKDESIKYEGPVCVMMTTHNRTEIACACLKSLKENLVWDDLHWVISDDRSEPGHVENILGFMEKTGFDMGRVTIRKTSPTAYGLGASMNNGLKAAFEVAEIVLRTEDDWFLKEPFYVQKYVDVLTDGKVAGIRLGYCSNQQTEDSLWPGFLKVHSGPGAKGRDRYIFNNQVMFVHRRTMGLIGPYLENHDSRYVEDFVSKEYGEKTDYGMKSPYVLIDRSFHPFELNNGSPFMHIGNTSTFGTKYEDNPKDVAEAIEKASQTIRQSDKCTVHFCLISNDDYIDKVSVTVKSISENLSPFFNGVIHLVMVDELSERSKGLLEKASGRLDIDVVYPPRSIVKKCMAIDPTKRLGGEVHTMSKKYGMTHLGMKFFLSDILPVNKVMYVDGDVIMRKDPSEMYFTDMSDSYMCAVEDAWNLSQNKREPMYINSGVVVFNLDKMRTDKIPDRLEAVAQTVEVVFPFDQNVINDVVRTEKRLMPLHYNVPIHYISHHLHRNLSNIAKINSLYGTKYVSLDDIVGQSVFVHFCTGSKPWTTGCFGEDIWHYYNNLIK